MAVWTYQETVRILFIGSCTSAAIVFVVLCIGVLVYARRRKRWGAEYTSGMNTNALEVQDDAADNVGNNTIDQDTQRRRYRRQNALMIVFILLQFYSLLGQLGFLFSYIDMRKTNGKEMQRHSQFCRLMVCKTACDFDVYNHPPILVRISSHLDNGPILLVAGYVMASSPRR